MTTTDELVEQLSWIPKDHLLTYKELASKELLTNVLNTFDVNEKLTGDDSKTTLYIDVDKSYFEENWNLQSKTKIFLEVRDKDQSKDNSQYVMRLADSESWTYRTIRHKEFEKAANILKNKLPKEVAVKLFTNEFYSRA